MQTRSPYTSIKSYDLHVVFSDTHREEAQLFFQQFLTFLEDHQIAYQKHRFFSEPVGPWPTPMWQCILPISEQVHQSLGLCISWFMLNRGDFSVMIHPNTHQEGEWGGVYEDHHQNHLWLGAPLELKLELFKKK